MVIVYIGYEPLKTDVFSLGLLSMMSLSKAAERVGKLGLAI